MCSDEKDIRYKKSRERNMVYRMVELVMFYTVNEMENKNPTFGTNDLDGGT